MNNHTTANLMELLPLKVQRSVINFETVGMKDGKTGIRVTLNRLLTPEEKRQMKSKYLVGLECVARHRYAPELTRSYFYVVW